MCTQLFVSFFFTFSGSWHGRILLTFYSTVNLKPLAQVCFTISEVAADCHEQMIPSQRTVRHSSRIRFFTFFFENPKKRDFLRFWSGMSKKRKKRNPKFEVSDFADFSLNGISTTTQKQESLANANVKRATALHVWRHMTSIGTTVAKLWPFLYVQDGRKPPSWILSNCK